MHFLIITLLFWLNYWPYALVVALLLWLWIEGDPRRC